MESSGCLVCVLVTTVVVFQQVAIVESFTAASRSSCTTTKDQLGASSLRRPRNLPIRKKRRTRRLSVQEVITDRKRIMSRYAARTHSSSSSSSSDENSSGDDIVLVSAVRTPLCRARKGGFKDVPASTLFQTVLEEVVERAGNGITPTDVDDVCVGNVLLPPAGFAVLRMAQLSAGFPDTCSLSTTNRQCASGLQAIANIAQAIQADQIRVGIAAGVESMSLHSMPSVLSNKLVDWKNMSRQAMDCLLPMGITSETVAKEFGIERHVLDAFATESHRKAAAAQASGNFDREIVAVSGITKDDGIRPKTSVETLSRLRPAFVPQGGTTTAGNSSQLTDGAAAVLMMKRSEAQRRRLPVLATWRGFSVAGVPPSIMGIGPLVAIPAVLEQTGLQKDQIGVYEINEAFASQALYCIDQLQLDKSKVNPNGGAIALGHPLGCTGTRLVVTLIHELQRQKQSQYGVVSMCVGTGMGAAAVLEIEPQSAL